MIKCFRKTDPELHICKEWWDVREGLYLPNACISDYGFMYYEADTALAAIFFFPVLGCKMGFIGYPIASPGLETEKRRAILQELVDAVECFAKTMEYEWLVSYPGNKGAAGIFERADYKLGDTEVKQFLKML